MRSSAPSEVMDLGSIVLCDGSQVSSSPSEEMDLLGLNGRVGVIPT